MVEKLITKSVYKVVSYLRLGATRTGKRVP